MDGGARDKRRPERLTEGHNYRARRSWLHCNIRAMGDIWHWQKTSSPVPKMIVEYTEIKYRPGRRNCKRLTVGANPTQVDYSLH